MMRRISAGLSLVLCAGTAFFSRAEPPAAELTAADDPEGWSFWAEAAEEYRLRLVRAETGAPDPGVVQPFDENDHDVRLLLDAGWTSPRERFSGSFSLALWTDLDGFPGAGPSTLGSLYDYGHPEKPIWFDVYGLFAEYRPGGWLKSARLGRQTTEFGTPVTFDGAALELALARPWLGAFVLGGRTVHFFEVGDGVFEDWIASGGMTLRPARWLKLDLDYRLAVEDVTGADGTSREALRDHFYGMKASIRPAGGLHLMVFFRMINDAPAWAGAQTRLSLESSGIAFLAKLESQLSTLRQLSEGEDVFHAILGESLPFLRWTLEASKTFGFDPGELTLRVGWNGRKLLQGEEGPFNRSLNRAFLSGELRDLGVRGLFVNLSVDGLVVPQGATPQSEWRLALGGAVGYERKTLRIEAGTSYQRYRIAYYRIAEELEDVRSFYARAEVRPLSWLRLQARYEFDRADRSLHTIILGLAQSY